MHIREVNEDLDYHLFMTKGPPAEHYTEALGTRAWKLLHGIADNYGCEACRHGAQTLISGIHDVVNVHLKKPVFDEKRFKEFSEMVEDANKLISGATHEKEHSHQHAAHELEHDHGTRRRH